MHRAPSSSSSCSHEVYTAEPKQVNGGGSILSFRHLSYAVNTKRGQKMLIDEVSVDVYAGQLLAIMGPSGAGKSTLLDVMSYRKHALQGGSIHLNGHPLEAKDMHRISTFVEQEDALLGVLTVRESISYALRLHLPLLPRNQVHDRVERVIQSLGLQSCAEQIIGTAISRGISGGQKRRVTAACAMVTFPRILYLDEVTSGLDSTSAREVMTAISYLAKEEGIIVIATIHQPSLETLAQFTNLMFLGEGKMCYLGRVDELDGFFERWGRPVGRFTTPSDHAMNFLNSDFAGVEESSTSAREFREFYLSISSANAENKGHSEHTSLDHHENLAVDERTAVNYRRNLLAYGVRAGMYAGMGLMLATIWIRLGTADSTINDRFSVHFYSVAFLAFMSVAGIPSFLEERAVYYRETKNGLYTTLPFLLSNTLVNIPFLLTCTILFTCICYWAIGLHSGAKPFFRFVIFLFLAIFTAETQALIIASFLPIFVAALAITSLWVVLDNLVAARRLIIAWIGLIYEIISSINGFWMSVGGYFIKARSLPRFWFFSFHYIDYQKYAFELLTNSDFRGLNFTCATKLDNSCVCAYPSSTPDSCTVSGADVLDYLDIGSVSYGKWAAILVSISIMYRIVLYFALKARST